VTVGTRREGLRTKEDVPDTRESILVHEPRPRNERLAEAFKRIGLIEKTGRGVDKIYLGQLWYGRPAPDYSRSDDTAVRLVLSSPPALLEYVKFIFEAEREGHPFDLDELLIITTLSCQPDLDAEEARMLIQKSQYPAERVLEHLIERGIFVVLGDQKPLRYSLSGEIFRTLFGVDLYIRIHGTDPSVQEKIIIEYVRAHGQISRDELAQNIHITRDQSRRIIERMVRSGALLLVKKSPRRVIYVLADRV
jgi:ATP-dependent DNA helicase RecG